MNMNKIIIYYDDGVVTEDTNTEGPDYILAKFAGLGYTFVNSYSTSLEFPSNSRFLVVGYYAWKAVTNQISLGLRGAKHWPHCMLRRVGISDNRSFVFCYDTSDFYIKEAIDKFEDPNLEVIDVPEPPKVEDVDTVEDIDKAFNYLLAHTDDFGFYGYDYESSGFPESLDFMFTGLGISTLSRAFWFDYRFYDEATYRYFNERHLDFLRKKADKCIVFSVRFEKNASYLAYKEWFEYKDLNAVNILKQYGNWMGLKWTARDICNVLSWDEEFEDIVPLINAYVESGRSEETKQSLVNYGMSLADMEEIDHHLETKEDGFYAIPKRFLGKYCALDCHYTLASWLKELPKWNYDPTIEETPTGIVIDQMKALPEWNKLPYETQYQAVSEVLSKNALDVYTAGLNFSTILNGQGMIKDKDFWEYSKDLGERMLLLSSTALVEYYYIRCIKENEDRNNLEDYLPVTRKFILEGIDVSSGGYNLSKSLFNSRYYNDACEWNLDLNQMISDFGEEIGKKLEETLWWYVDSLDGISRKRKVHTEIGYILDEHVTVSEHLQPKHTATVNYYYYQKQLEYVRSLPWYQVDYRDYKTEYEIEGEIYQLDSCKNLIIGMVNINSNDNSNWIYNQNYKSNTEIRVFTDARYMEKMENLVDTVFTGDFMEDYRLFLENFESTTDECKEYIAEVAVYDQSWKMKHLVFLNWTKYHYPEFHKEIVDKSFTGEFYDDERDFFMVQIYQRIWAKYFKVYNTYLMGTFYSNDCNYDELDDLWMSRPVDYEFDYDKPVKSYAQYQPNQQYSMRWSSGFHTVPSRSEVKTCMSSPDDALLSYFDISQAEVRTQAYLAMDKKMIESYETGVDLYILCSKVFYPDADYDDWEVYADMRGQFKVVLLALTYGRSAPSLGYELGVSTEEAQAQMDIMYNMFPQLKQMIDFLSMYPVNHPSHRLLTVLGEWIESWESYGRQKRHGINTVMQGFTAVALVYGFNNLLVQSRKHGFRLAPVSLVHDSTSSYFDIKWITKINSFYLEHFTDFLWDIFRIKYKFTVLVGANYYDSCEIKDISEDTIQFDGTAKSINKILDRLELNNVEYELVDIKEGTVKDGRMVEDIAQPLRQFISTGAMEAIFKKDNNSYKQKIKFNL